MVQWAILLAGISRWSYLQWFDTGGLVTERRSRLLKNLLLLSQRFFVREGGNLMCGSSKTPVKQKPKSSSNLYWCVFVADQSAKCITAIRISLFQPSAVYILFICTQQKSITSNTTTNINTNVTHTHTQPFNGPFSGTTWVSRYQKGKTNLDFTKARDSEWQWHQLGHMQVCISLHTDNHASTPPLKFFTGRMPFLLPNQQHQSTESKYQC